MSLPTSLLPGSLAPPSPALWRSLAVSLSEKVAFEPELRREILKRLVTEWLDQPDFENEPASILKKLSEPASDLRESLLESLNAVGQGASPIIALWVLRLQVRLFGWPKTEATESEKILKELGTLLASTNPQGLPEEVIVGASELVIDAGLDEISSRSEGSRCLQFLRQLWQGRMLNPEGSVSDRTSAGVMAGLLGDVRPGVGIYPGAAKIPHFAWCGPGGEVSEFHTFSQAFPARRFMMGGDRGAFGSFPEPMACTRLQTRYYIAKYPVTVAQYQSFVTAGGYESVAGVKPPWWTEAGWAWLEGRTHSQFWPAWLKEEYHDTSFPIRGPREYLPAFQTPNHPQVGISWFEARAYCAWLNSSKIRPLLKLPATAEIRLPTEAEWEQAARWNLSTSRVDGRSFPWESTGSELPTDEDFSARCNWGKTGIGQTSAVGLFPKGNADCGAADLAGNVWEWCQSKWIKSGEHWSAKEYNDLKNGLDEEEGDGDRILRGGSWQEAHPAALRAAIRYFSTPAGRINSIGFRVVCVVGSSLR